MRNYRIFWRIDLKVFRFAYDLVMLIAVNGNLCFHSRKEERFYNCDNSKKK